MAGFVTGITAILGIVFGLVARHRIARSEGSNKGRWLALSGVVLGVAAIAWSIVVAEVVTNLLVSTESDPPSLALINQLARAAVWRLNHH